MGRGVEPNGTDLSCPKRPLEGLAMEGAAVVHGEGDGDADSDLPENVAEHRRLEQGTDLVLVGEMASLMKRGS